MSSKRRWPVIEGNADLLAEDEALTPEQREQVEAILRGTEQTRMMKKEAARLCGNARMAGHFALHEQEKYGIIKNDRV